MCWSRWAGSERACRLANARDAALRRGPIATRSRPHASTMPCSAPSTWSCTTVTTLYFEADEEDELRKVGYSNCAEVAVLPRWWRRWSSCWSAGWVSRSTRHDPRCVCAGVSVWWCLLCPSDEEHMDPVTSTDAVEDTINRLVHHVEVISMKADSYRLKTATSAASSRPPRPTGNNQPTRVGPAFTRNRRFTIRSR